MVQHSLHLGLDLEGQWECHPINVAEVEPDTWSWHFSLVDISVIAGLSWNECALCTDVNDVVFGHTSAVGALHIWRGHRVGIRYVVVSGVQNCRSVECFVVLVVGLLSANVNGI